ncbi:putative cell cycle inhibitor Nif1 [Podospora conica]|nr:putative cell cycle inhibitor Nif1 [Schizothecium conicum]
MGLRDLLKKKQGIDVDDAPDRSATVQRLAAPEFTFVRSDTYTEEVIHPPGGPASERGDDESTSYLTVDSKTKDKSRLSLDVFRSKDKDGRSRSASVSSRGSGAGPSPSKRLSQRLHLSRNPVSSDNVPHNLPEIITPADPETDKEGQELQWEKRATMLVRGNDIHRSRPSSPVRDVAHGLANTRLHDGSRVVSSKEIDEDIQEAIRLHEAGDLERSTALFGRLADPKGANNPLSQVLYGLALRHGWGCKPDAAAAVNYLSAAASNAADIENLALQAGLKKGGAAKGELVLAIFELANCFRHGWGIPKDPIAAKQYYETAANLGDTDAMNEVAWCYLEGFGTKKDKFEAAKYYRLAEKSGNKTIGNTWIWKDKYNPENRKK